MEGVLKEAERRVKRYLPEREKEGMIARVVSRVCKEEGVGVGEMRMGGQRLGVSLARERIAWVLSREYGVSLAEIGRQVGVCTSAVGKALRKKEG